MLLADLAVPIPLAHALTYSVPAALDAQVVPGARVLAPLGSRRIIGVVLAKREGEPPKGVRDILRAIDDMPSVPADLLAFLQELAAYYMAPLGDVLRMALPPIERAVAKEIASPSLFDHARGIGDAKVQWVEAKAVAGGDPKMTKQAEALLARVRALGSVPIARLAKDFSTARGIVKRLEDAGLLAVVLRAPFEAPQEPSARDEVPTLTDEQQVATTAIGEAIAEGRRATFLLHGITGSGKTEVYFDAIGRARAMKKGAVVLVPEIALTPQLVQRYKARFGDDVAVLHSGLTPKERHVMWHRLRAAEVDVAIGARSALFSPVPNLGLVIVDEEHDSSFKQEEGVRYNARDMAILRAHRLSGVCILGSATPSLESEYMTRTGRAQKLRLHRRAREQPLPEVRIIDLRRTGAGPTGDKRLSLPLHRALEATLAAKDQAILFLNRRGFSPSVRCESCGHLLKCPSCSVALTFHKRGSIELGIDLHGGHVRCHYCDHFESAQEKCPKCRGKLALEGIGTEKLEETLAAAFPGARVARLDRDVATGKKIEKILQRVRDHEVDILVGTQMVTKGHDLPRVTLVGVVNGDAALSIPDFRAAERAFQLMVQVAGRAGRGDSPGLVLVQTHDPEHFAITFASKHDVDGFLERELIDRKELMYPPFSRLALIRIDGPDDAAVRRTSETLAATAHKAAARGVDILGPARAPIARLRNRYRYRIMLRATERPLLRPPLVAIDRLRPTLPRAIRVTLDIDPVQLL